jgi:hypothetical protein
VLNVWCTYQIQKLCMKNNVNYLIEFFKNWLYVDNDLDTLY